MWAYTCTWAHTSTIPVGSVAKTPPAKQEVHVRSLGQEDPLEKEMATHSNILAWEIHGQGSLAGYNPQGRKKVRQDLVTKHHHHHICFYVYAHTHICRERAHLEYNICHFGSY